MNDHRMEIKCIGPELMRPNVLAWIKTLPFHFEKSYFDREIKNVYFDTYNLDAYEENLSGSSRRTKVRYRWYGPGFVPDQGYFELKIKRNNLGWKKRHAIQNQPYFSGATWQEIRELIIKQLPVEYKIFLKQNPKPVILNSYYREYFESKDKSIRITIDSKQLVYDQRYFSIPNLDRDSIVYPKFMIMEFKFSPIDKARVGMLISSCPIRVTRNSKYVNAIRSIYQY